MNLAALWAAVRRWYDGHSPRDQRIILGVVGAVGLALVYVALVEPLLAYRREVAEEIVEGHEQLERGVRFLGAIESLRTERDEARRRLEQAKARLLPGDSGTLGAAALQERANSIASEKGITVQSTQVMREETVEPFRKVAVRLTLSGELRPFADFIAGLEYGPQQLAIPFVEVSRRGAVAGAKGPRTLSATVEVSGFLQGRAQGEHAKGEGEAEGEPGEAEAIAGPALEGPPAEGQPVEGQGVEGRQADGPPAAGAEGTAPPPSPPATAPPLPPPAPTGPPAAAAPAPAPPGPVPSAPAPTAPPSTAPARPAPGAS